MQDLKFKRYMSVVDANQKKKDNGLVLVLTTSIDQSLLEFKHANEKKVLQEQFEA